ncbi:6-phosphogluconolactonase [Streptomyces sp. SAI-208]|uniref:lactonase family protein n=1 Tax=unclassified Streptomyces TaxID=2593676 RepID=UPI002476954E|nr:MULTISPECIES: lactonase family protein [unclassified Streptomyces]MDH6520850.1 6-phosphogluconolactonase [Streptomyces sp. SAI-090]MDH6553070.1 6-phosphogluconolactonase [Streptomyces sp. SAI-041]MDH6572152.1 6-phosphogluconolactonase [Streptomyces sp. SAI-117]MDH6582889.1 6-phosphogluconolactonase [Streptomyces sp. SAI-133]MDH6611843.1 6-phosphogluconolactonase [Streptomyces sp. SAI-208]
MADGGGRRRAWIGSFTAAGGPGIVTAAVTPGTGALKVLSGLDAVPDPSYLALSSDGDVLYAVSETAEGAVAAYRVTGDRPEPAGPPVAVDGNGPTHLAVHAGHVLTANYGSGSVTTLPLRPDGTLAGAPSGVLRHTGAGPHTPRQQGPHAHQVQPDPSGRWVVSVDLGTDSVRVCTLTGGTLDVHREIALRPGSGPRHLAFHPDGTRAYVLNELTPTLTVCRWDAEEGFLKPLSEVPVLAGAPSGDAYPSGVVTSPDGRFVWTATRGEDVLSTFAVEGDELRLVGTVICGGHWPRALAEYGGFLYVANERSGDVTWFAVDPATGLPRYEGSIEVPAASCVIFD